MLRQLFLFAVAVAITALAAFWVLTIPGTVPASALGPYAPNLDNGKTMFFAGGCASCHATHRPGRQDQARRRAWAEVAVRHVLRAEHFARHERRHRPMDRSAFRHRDGEGHIARRTALFPRVSLYVLSAHEASKTCATCSPISRRCRRCRAGSRDHDVPFPFNIRRTLGGWKLLFLDGEPFKPDASKDAAWNRGAYLVNGPGHCAECHSPRNLLGGIVARPALRRWARRRRAATAGCRTSPSTGCRPGRRRTS